MFYLFQCIEFELDELLHQCLSVETDEKIFHHYNFSVKMKQAGSDKWSSVLYFAQVKEMYGRKFYLCYPLDPFEDGICLSALFSFCRFPPQPVINF